MLQHRLQWGLLSPVGHREQVDQLPYPLGMKSYHKTINHSYALIYKNITNPHGSILSFEHSANVW